MFNKINKINLEVLVQIIVEIFGALLLMSSLYTGKINLFVHPKFNIALWISAVFLVIIAVVSSLSLFKPRHMNILTRYFVVVIPILVSFYISSEAINKLPQPSFDVGRGVRNSIPTSVSPQLNTFKPTEYKKKDGKSYVEIDDTMYLKWYYDSTFSWEKYKGMKFRFLGRVFKDANQKGEFVVLGRFGMVCCMADMQPCGFIYKGPKKNQLKNGQWYWITGEIKENKKIAYNYEKLPMIDGVSFEEAREPTDQYVYIH